MTAHLPRIDLTGRTLLLDDRPGPHVDVVVADLDGVAPGDVADTLARVQAAHDGPIGVCGGRPSAVGAAVAAGVALVALEADDTPDAEVRAVVESGCVVLLHHAEIARAVGAVDRLVAAGVDTSRVVVEAGPDPDVVEEATVLDRTAFGYRVGACLGASPAAGQPAPGMPPGRDERRDGWEIGALTGLLGLGVATIRGVSGERFARVRSVLDALDRADRSPGPASRDRSSPPTEQPVAQ